MASSSVRGMTANFTTPLRRYGYRPPTTWDGWFVYLCQEMPSSDASRGGDKHAGISDSAGRRSKFKTTQLHKTDVYFQMSNSCISGVNCVAWTALEVCSECTLVYRGTCVWGGRMGDFLECTEHVKCQTNANIWSTLNTFSRPFLKDPQVCSNVTLTAQHQRH